MPTQLLRIDLLLFAVFLMCGWLVMLIGVPTLTTDMQPSRRRFVLIGGPIFAAACCIVAFTPLVSSTSGSVTAREWIIVLLTPLIFLAAIGSVIAVPLALRYKARGDRDDHASSIAQHVHEHHAHVHEHVHGDEAGHTHGTIQVLPRGTFPRRTREP